MLCPKIPRNAQSVIKYLKSVWSFGMMFMTLSLVHVPYSHACLYPDSSISFMCKIKQLNMYVFRSYKGVLYNSFENLPHHPALSPQKMVIFNTSFPSACHQMLLLSFYFFIYFFFPTYILCFLDKTLFSLFIFLVKFPNKSPNSCVTCLLLCQPFLFIHQSTSFLLLFKVFL